MRAQCAVDEIFCVFPTEQTGSFNCTRGDGVVRCIKVFVLIKSAQQKILENRVLRADRFVKFLLQQAAITIGPTNTAPGNFTNF